VPRVSVDRPLLREAVNVSIIPEIALEGLDVLYDAEFLVVRLLHQKAVVFDLGFLLRSGLRADSNAQEE
jgi:hypothetical protein